MANSTTILDLVSPTQAQKEQTLNALVDAGSPSVLFGRRANTTTALSWGYYGGNVYINGVLIDNIPNGVITLTNNASNYLEMNNTTGALTKNITGFTVGTGFTPIYRVNTSAGLVTSYIDYRAFLYINTGSLSNLSGLSDTNIITPANGQFLTFNGTDWVNSTISYSLSDLNNIALTSPALNQVLTFNGTNWINKTPASSGGSSEYYNDTRKLKGYRLPYFDVAGALLTGTWSGTVTQVNATASNDGYGIWGHTQRNILTTGAVSGNQNTLYKSAGHFVNRYEFERFAYHFNVGSVTGYTIGTLDVSVMIAGLSNTQTTAIGTNNDFTSKSNLTFGVGFRSTDTNMQIIYHNSSNVLTFIDLGTNFPKIVDKTTNHAYEIIIKKTDNTNNITFIVNKIGTAFTSTNTVAVYFLTSGYKLYPVIQIRTVEAVAKVIHIGDILEYIWNE